MSFLTTPTIAGSAASTTATHPANPSSTPAGQGAERYVLDAPPGSSRGWAWAGLAAGIGGFAVFLLPGMALDVPTEAYADNALVLAELDGKAGWVWAFQAGTFAVAVLAVIFGVGLRRRLAGQAPAGSLLADLSALGLLLVAALLLVGGGISTEMFHALRHPDEVDPDTIGTHLALFNTLGWVWAGGILTTGAIAVAGLRHASVGKGVARFAAAMTALVTVTQLLPFQYLAVAPVALFLIVCSVSMLRSERRAGQ
ncbi:MAG TPA: hypothetical protein VNQ73_21825 [Ilumatobacter sp.]|nr:hypothetical protein [Ilumatobacter sp.]